MSVAFDLMPHPDWAATTTVAMGCPGARTSEQWARAIFDISHAPPWIRGFFGLRVVAARVLRLPPASPAMLAVDKVIGEEAVIDTDDRHLRFVATVSVEADLVHVTTAVTLKGLRGRLYFVPVRLLHDSVTRSLMTSAGRRTAT